MKKICLVQGGKFLLGIDAEHIVSRTAWAEVGPLRREGRRTVHLGALLARRPAVVQPEAVCLELAEREGSFFLLVDRIADEVEIEAPPRPLPPSCPFLAARLCPQVTVCRHSAVLLLDPAQAIPICEQLGGGIGLLAPAEALSASQPLAVAAADAAELCRSPSESSAASEAWPASAPEVEAAVAASDAAELCRSPSEPSAASEAWPASAPEVEAAVAASDAAELCRSPSESSAASEAWPASAPEVEAAVAAADAAELCRSPSEPSAASEAWPASAPASTVEASQSLEAAATKAKAAEEKEKMERSAAIDEETFKKVMTWTIARFKQKQPGEHLHLGMEQLPSDLAGMVQKKGVSRNVIQYLIDQIVLRCQESVHRKMPGDSHVG